MPYINVATEDELAEIVACRMIATLSPNFEVRLKLRKGGTGYLKASMHKFRSLAQREHVYLLTDLDSHECAPSLRAYWSGADPLPPQLTMRICVREVEAWILADRVGFSRLLGISRANLPRNPDALDDPKRFLLNIARKANRALRADLLATRGAVASQGLGYNRVLGTFIRDEWSLDRARENSRSLDKAATALQLACC